MPQPRWVDDFAQEVIAEFCKGYGAHDLESAIIEHNRLLWKARFRKQLQIAINKRLDREIAEAVKEIM